MNERVSNPDGPHRGTDVDRAASPSRTVAGWVGWHGGELLGVGTPLVAGWLANGWWLVVSAAVAVWCAVHEVRTRREQTAERATVNAPGAPDAITAGHNADAAVSAEHDSTGRDSDETGQSA